MVRRVWMVQRVCMVRQTTCWKNGVRGRKGSSPVVICRSWFFRREEGLGMEDEEERGGGSGWLWRSAGRPERRERGKVVSPAMGFEVVRDDEGEGGGAWEKEERDPWGREREEGGRLTGNYGGGVATVRESEGWSEMRKRGR
ncbi:hypothetical protein HAX54_041983 [Datura stramonium]|uniref:Uncharacterized protein n=1 Tax=Datura stramonium TaxID=4076 RepID=A0ABS8W3I3_DATST|nr:hypothetical protein [Datura stramonium]